MSKSLRLPLLVAIGTLGAVGLAARALHAGDRPTTRASAAAPARTGPVRGLVLAQPFTLEEPYLHVWRAEQPEVRAGWLLVIEVDPSFVEPRQTAMPVLLVGDQTAECVNFGESSGRVIAIVPAVLDERGAPDLDRVSGPAWFGAPELPERVDAGWIARERARALPESLATFTADEAEAARKLGGASLAVASRVELERRAAQLILAHSPQDRELAESLLVPVTK